jgi:hypothetical protein
VEAATFTKNALGREVKRQHVTASYVRGKTSLLQLPRLQPCAEGANEEKDIRSSGKESVWGSVLIQAHINCFLRGDSPRTLPQQHPKQATSDKPEERACDQAATTKEELSVRILTAHVVQQINDGVE